MKYKYIFWIYLGLLSTFFAEVVSGSFPYPLFDYWGYYSVIPLYTLHILVLGTVVFRGKPNIFSLFAAGAIFGLYEAYITKVLWDPNWGPYIIVGGVAPIQTLALVFFWHPFMAFIIPLLFAEIITSSREIMGGMPQWFINRFSDESSARLMLLIFAILCGAYKAMNSTPSLGFASALINGFIIFFLGIWLREHVHEESMRDLMPNTREFKILSGALILYYIYFTATLRVDSLPGIMPQIIIWILYGLFGYILWKTYNLDFTHTVPRVSISPAYFVILIVLFSIGSAILMPFGLLTMLFTWTLGIGSGILITIAALIIIFKGK